MNEAHTILHDIKQALGLQQCTATQALGICLEFWVGGAVAVGAVKVRELLRFRDAVLTGKRKPLSKPKKQKQRKKRSRKKR